MPKVERTISMLKDFKYGYMNEYYAYDERTYKLLDELFKILIEKIKPAKKISDARKMWTLWFKVERGTIEAFGDFEEMKSDYEVETYEEF